MTVISYSVYCVSIYKHVSVSISAYIELLYLLSFSLFVCFVDIVVVCRVDVFETFDCQV